ncbi:RDD family protein [Streptomyces sp. NBC_01498]|uniref:RDD family protein n=1 Tax=Streptomyces sp. NBC_01498 TaxID=2975870 RepID=UPI002E7BD354|nr:RDD family protein [Streptomyces sp. NBC_01498]WTL26675.1 RDD family protein [Streptomyces sp. NBC_01498]
MSNDQPTPGQPPDDDPLRKQPPPDGPPPPGGPPPGGGPAPGSGEPYGGSQPPPPGSPYGGADPPPPGDPYGGSPPPPPGDPYGRNDPLRGMPPLASVGKRILARIVDWIIVAVPLALISIPFNVYTHWSNESNSWNDTVNGMNGGGQWVFRIIALIAYVGYDTVMTQRGGRTIGKKLFKIRVAMLNDGRVPDSRASFLRAVVLWVPALVCCACLWPLLILLLLLLDRPYRQGLHDKAARTVVVSAPQ